MHGRAVKERPGRQFPRDHFVVRDDVVLGRGGRKVPDSDTSRPSAADRSFGRSASCVVAVAPSGMVTRTAGRPDPVTGGAV